MHSVKRIEIIANSLELSKILNCLERVNVPGYSIIRNVTGKSSRGVVSDDSDFESTKLSNIYIICFCSQEQTQSLAEQIKPILNKYGGVCYVSDAQEITSLRCVAS
jgi:nitrogen regulatory protein PII